MYLVVILVVPSPHSCGFWLSHSRTSQPEKKTSRHDFRVLDVDAEVNSHMQLIGVCTSPNVFESPVGALMVSKVNSDDSPILFQKRLLQVITCSELEVKEWHLLLPSRDSPSPSEKRFLIQ